MPIPNPVEMDYQSPPTGGLGTNARSLPNDWQRGISFIDESCFSANSMGECPSSPDKTADRPETVTFQPVSIYTGIECSTLGDVDGRRLAERALDNTREAELARELLTGDVSENDARADGDGNPNLAGSADSVGSGPERLVDAVAALEESLKRNDSAGRGYMLASPAILTYLKYDSLVWRDGNTWRTANGLTVVTSEGFDGRSPGSSSGPSDGDNYWLYATSTVWAGFGQRDVLESTNRRVNDRTVIAEDVALAAFTPCSTFAVELPDTVVVR